MKDLFQEEMISLIPRMRRFARSLTGDADRADDLVQDAIEKALTRRDQWADGTRLDSWMFRILRNRWIDVLRKVKTRGEEVSDIEAEDLAGADGRQDFEAAQQRREVLRALNALSRQHRETVALVLIEGLSYREAAEMMGVTEGTIASRLSRAKAVLELGLQEMKERRAT